jgi:hypothetical protein
MINELKIKKGWKKWDKIKLIYKKIIRKKKSLPREISRKKRLNPVYKIKRKQGKKGLL